MLVTSYFHLTFSHGTRLLLLLLWVFRSTKKTFKGAISDVAHMGLGLASLTSEFANSGLESGKEGRGYAVS